MKTNVFNSFCGTDCFACNAYLATINNDFKLKENVAQEWTKGFGKEYKPEDVHCDGCKSANGKTCDYCSSMCEMRSCAITKNIETCAHCSDFPACAIFSSGNYDWAKGRLEEIKSKL